MVRTQLCLMVMGRVKMISVILMVTVDILTVLTMPTVMVHYGWETWKQKEQIQLEWQEPGHPSLGWQQALENEADDRFEQYERKGSSGSGQLAVQDGDTRDEGQEDPNDTFPEGDPSSFQPGMVDDSPQLARDGTQETFGTSQASWHSYGEVPQGTGNWRSQRPRPMPKDRKRTSLAASAQNAAKAKSIPPPGPRAVWGGNAGPGASAAGGAGTAGAASAASGSAQEAMKQGVQDLMVLEDVLDEDITDEVETMLGKAVPFYEQFGFTDMTCALALMLLFGWCEVDGIEEDFRQRFSDDGVQLATSAQRVSTDGLRWADQDLATMADGDDDDDDQP
eukprot:s178_g12.t1